MKKIYFLYHLIIFLFLFGLSNVSAESTLEDEVKSMKTQMELMQKKLTELEAKVQSQNSEITNQKSAKEVYEKRITDLENQLAQQQRIPLSVAAVNRPTTGKWTPEIGAVADTVFTSTSTKADQSGANRLSLRELELVLGSNVDPYSRLDATISFSDEDNPSLEEAYLTRFDLPFETTARLGKFKPKVGKVLGTHRDSLDTVDEPIVIQRYFGTEGMNKSGLDFTKTLNLPWPVTQQVAFGVLEGGNGENGTAFGTTRRAPTLYGHLKNYIDLSDTSGLEIGFSPMIGSGGDEPGFDAQVLGADMTLTQHVGPIQTVKWQNEVFNLNRRKTTGIDTNNDGIPDVKVDGNLWGAYSLLDYHFHPQWSAGFRYDYVQLVNNNPTINPHNNDNGETGYLTFYQSEFARWRLQYQHLRLATGKDDNTVYLQGTFAIGDHKHKLQ